jgi:hypothetical protein
MCFSGLGKNVRRKFIHSFMSKKYFCLRTISICFVERRAGRDHVFTTWASASGPPTFPAKSQESYSEL